MDITGLQVHHDAEAIMITETTLTDFLGRARGIVKAARQARRAIDRALAPQFCPITLFNPNENDLSRVIAFLLDPKEQHGQGMTFLRLFLALAGLPPSNDQPEDVCSRREHNVAFGRVDIRVCYTGLDGEPVVLLIENKPCADDGERQIERYAESAEKSLPETNWVIVYMPAGERDPPDSSISRDKLKELKESRRFVIVPYATEPNASEPGDQASVVLWLERCAEQCQAEAPRRFLLEFRRYLEQKTINRGESTMSEAERIGSAVFEDFLAERPENLDSAIEIARALSGLREDLVKKVVKRIDDGVHQSFQGWDVTGKISNGRLSGLNIRRNTWPTGKNQDGDPSDLAVSIECDRREYRTLGFGVSGHTNIIPDDLRRRIFEAVKKELPPSNRWGQEEFWPVYSSQLTIPSDWQSDDFLRFALKVTRDDPEARESLATFIKQLVRMAELVDRELAASKNA